MSEPRIIYTHSGKSSYHDGKEWVMVDTCTIKPSGVWLDPGQSIAVIDPPKPAFFGGAHAEEYDVLRQALKKCAADEGLTGEHAEYDWLEAVPRTSLVVFLVDQLHRMGYKITKHETEESKKTGQKIE